MQAEKTSQAITLAYVWLSVPVTLPLVIIEQIEHGKLMPDVLFDVVLACDATENYGLNASDVFNIDGAHVEVERFEQ